MTPHSYPGCSVLHLACVPTVLAALCCAGGGCTTAAVASAGTMVGLAASAVSTGADVYRLGKLDSADEARFDDWVIAVHTAATELDLKIVTESRDDDKGEWRCTLVDDRNAKVKVTVTRRTRTLCHTRIDVGWFGSQPTARLILARVRLDEDPAITKAGAAGSDPVGPPPRR